MQARLVFNSEGIHKTWNTSTFWYTTLYVFVILLICDFFMKKSLKKIFALPIIWLILGAVSIAAEIKTTNLIAPGKILSPTLVHCIRDALDARETDIISAMNIYQSDSLTALITRKFWLLAAFDNNTKSDIKSETTAIWKIYTSSMTDLKNTLHTSRTNAWSTYKTAVKTCKWTSLVQNVDASSVNSEQ